MLGGARTATLGLSRPFQAVMWGVPGASWLLGRAASLQRTTPVWAQLASQIKIYLGRLAPALARHALVYASPPPSRLCSSFLSQSKMVDGQLYGHVQGPRTVGYAIAFFRSCACRYPLSVPVPTQPEECSNSFIKYRGGEYYAVGHVRSSSSRANGRAGRTICHAIDAFGHVRSSSRANGRAGPELIPRKQYAFGRRGARKSTLSPKSGGEDRG